MVKSFLFVIKNFQCFVKMDKDWWVHDSIMSEEVNMNEQNEGEAGVNEEHIDYFDVFNTSQVLIWFIVIKISK